jgi:hypothetical protein
VSFPVAPGRPDERLALVALLALARGAGLGGARLFGYAARPRPFAGDVAHAGAALGALVLTAAGVGVAPWGLVAIALSAGARCLGAPSLADLVPRRPCWGLVLRAAGPRTARVAAVALDRVRPTPAAPWVMLAAVGIALLSTLGGLQVRAAAAVALVGVGAWAWWLGRPFRPDPAAPEAAAARAVLTLATRAAADADDTTAILLVGCGSEDGAGVRAYLDWWALPRSVAVHLAPGAGGAAAALTRAGWRVSPTLPEPSPPDPRSSS